MWAWYRKRMVGVQEVIHFKKNISKFQNFFYPLLVNKIDFWIFFRTSLVPFITYILVIKIGRAVFENFFFFNFSKFAHNFCKNFLFDLILRVNSSCSGSHLPSQYGWTPSGATQTMLILLRRFVEKNSKCKNHPQITLYYKVK